MTSCRTETETISRRDKAVPFKLLLQPSFSSIAVYLIIQLIRRRNMTVKSLFVSATLMLDIDVNDYYSVFQLNVLLFRSSLIIEFYRV